MFIFIAPVENIDVKNNINSIYIAYSLKQKEKTLIIFPLSVKVECAKQK